MELPIYLYGTKDSTFSAPGDSGSIIADGKGCIAGHLISGAGKTDSTDVMYAMPFYWLFDEHVKKCFPLYPDSQPVCRHSKINFSTKFLFFSMFTPMLQPIYNNICTVHSCLFL